MRRYRKRYKRNNRRRLFFSAVLLLSLTFIGVKSCQGFREPNWVTDALTEEQWPPLVMQGGNPYIRALMRTIAASESNYPNPYYVLYGGRYAKNLSRHPDICVRISVGPNKGRCTTAAGRYQMLTTTWQEMAERYHPKPSQFWFWTPYSFEAEYQDAVVYRWLMDKDFWGADIAELLQEGRLDEVLKLLSGTWTSLGYGIETNLMTSSLPNVYEKVLENELNQESSSLWLGDRPAQ